MLLNNQWVKEEITREIRKYFEINENANATYQHLRDAAITVFIEKFITVNTFFFLRRDLKSTISPFVLRNQQMTVVK